MGTLPVGGAVMWPLLAASLTGLALIIDRSLLFFSWSQNFPRFVEGLKPLM